MKEKIEIKKIVIKVGEKELSFSMEEAKELQNILNETFGGEKAIYFPSYPVYIEVERPYRITSPYNPYIPTWPTYTTWNTTVSDGTLCVSNTTIT